jgi:TRAP-type C4-dicarboxylate transport system permease small subunit
MLAVKGAFVGVASLIMAFTFLFVVILRYGFRADLFAYEEWLLIICFWLYFMASALGTYEDSHVNADLLDHFITDPRLKWMRALVVATIELVVSLAVIYWAILMIQDEISSYPYWQATIALKIPFLVPRLAVVVGFVFMTFYTGLRIYVLLKLGSAGLNSEPADSKADGDRTSRAE